MADETIKKEETVVENNTTPDAQNTEADLKEVNADNSDAPANEKLTDEAGEENKSPEAPKKKLTKKHLSRDFSN